MDLLSDALLRIWNDADCRKYIIGMIIVFILALVTDLLAFETFDDYTYGQLLLSSIIKKRKRKIKKEQEEIEKEEHELLSNYIESIIRASMEKEK